MIKNPWLLALLALGLLFLYLPIVTLIIYSFNNSFMVSVWGGWSTQWYGQLFQDQDVLEAAWLTVRLAVSAATCALVLGLMIAYALKRYQVFPGHRLLAGLTLSPLIMPDVATGLAVLLMFVSLQSWFNIANLGFVTMLIAHITFCTAYATIVLQARFNSIDRYTEEAAMDLGARPFKTFIWITLPQMFPSLISAWLLSITLSIDDLVITSFVRGPSNTTLPIYIFSTVKTWVTPEINALATLMLSIIAVCVVTGLVVATKFKQQKF